MPYFIDDTQLAQADQNATQRQMLEDMAETLSRESGRRVFRRLLKALGYGQPLTADAAAVANHNFASGLASLMLKAHEPAALEIIANTITE